MRSRVLIIAAIALAAGATLAQGAESQPEHARQACLHNDLLRTAYDCTCVATKAAQQKASPPSWQDAFNQLITSEAVRSCIRPASIRAESLRKCGQGYQQFRFLDRKKMGRASFCHCITDVALNRLPQTSMKAVPTLASGSGDHQALLQCGKLASYPVPADSILRQEPPKATPRTR
jgi:hypothetical protein